MSLDGLMVHLNISPFVYKYFGLVGFRFGFGKHSRCSLYDLHILMKESDRSSDKFSPSPVIKGSVGLTSQRVLDVGTDSLRTASSSISFTRCLVTQYARGIPVQNQ